MLIAMSSAAQVVSVPFPTPTHKIHAYPQLEQIQTPMEAFLVRLRHDFRNPIQPQMLKRLSASLLAQLRDGLQHSESSMLPAFIGALPTGNEHGSYLALDVGGSTFRVALVELCGRLQGPKEALRIVRSMDFAIDDSVRNLPGRMFFDWMAARIHEIFTDGESWLQGSSPIRAGLAWSFPIDQTSHHKGRLLQMGKGFRASDDLLGEDLALLLREACEKKNLNVRISAIINDSSASLLSSAYLNDTSYVALILGTGINATIYLPTSSLSPPKHQKRTSDWQTEFQNVLVNTEISMFGKEIFPLTRWDEILNLAHPRPDFQPLEHLTSGRYLGEIVRIVLIDAIRSTNLFHGRPPRNFDSYEMRTETMAIIEADTSTTCQTALSTFTNCHPPTHASQYSVSEMKQVRNIVTLVSTRSAAFVAAAIVALYELRLESARALESNHRSMKIGCNGGVLEKYPGFLGRVQAVVDDLVGIPGQVELVLTRESTLMGAAIAADGLS